MLKRHFFIVAAAGVLALMVLAVVLRMAFASDGESGGWRTGASLAEGKFLTIDQDKAVVHIEAPQDKEITRLSIQLNETYITYGADGARGKANQVAQDVNAGKFPAAGSTVQRAVTKASPSYSNAGWDLVDANQKKGLKLESLKEADLPPELKKLQPQERQAFIEEKAAERSRLQAEIQKLNEAREKHVAAKVKEKGEAETLDDAIGKAVREQAAKKKYEFAK